MNGSLGILRVFGRGGSQDEVDKAWPQSTQDQDFHEVAGVATDPQGRAHEINRGEHSVMEIREDHQDRFRRRLGGRGRRRVDRDSTGNRVSTGGASGPLGVERAQVHQLSLASLHHLVMRVPRSQRVAHSGGDNWSSLGATCRFLTSGGTGPERPIRTLA